MVSAQARERIAPSRLGLSPVLLLVACIVVPCAFDTELDAVFVVPKLALLWGLLAVSFAIGTLVVLRTGSARLSLGAIDVAVASFALLNVVAWLFSLDRQQSLYGERLQYQGLLTLFLYVGYFYVARVSIRDRRRLLSFGCAVVVGALLVSGYALVQRAGLDPVWKGFLPGGRVFSSIGQSNALAAYLVFAIPLCAALTIVGKRAVRIVALGGLLAATSALILTFSRGGYLGLFATAVVLAVSWRGELVPRARLLVPVLALIVAGAAIIAFTQPRAIAGADSLGRIVSTNDASARFHADAWRVAAHVVADRPLAGTGPETFPLVFPAFSHSVLPPERARALDAFRVESPHNVYLGIAAGSGIPALVAYLGILGAFATVVVRAARSAGRECRILLTAVLAAVVGHCVTDAFMTADLTSTWLTWASMGAALGVTATLRPCPAARTC